MPKENFIDVYEKLSTEKIEEFTSACLNNKMVSKTLYEPFKLALKDLFGAFLKFSVLYATLQNILKLNEPALKYEIKKIIPKITKIHKLLDLTLIEIENLSYCLKSFK